MSSLTKDFSLIIPHMFQKKSSGKDGFLIVLASGIGDAILAVDYIEVMIKYCENNSKKIQFVCGNGARVFLVEHLGLPQKYFCDITISGKKESIYALIDYYRDAEFEVVITGWNIIAVALKSQKTICWDSIEGYNGRSKLWILLQKRIYTKAYVLPQEQWVGYSIQCMNKDLGIECLKTKVPELRERLVSGLSPIIKSEKYIVLSIDSGSSYRRWPEKKFFETAEIIHDKYGFDIVFTSVLENFIIKSTLESKSYMIDMCGKTSFAELMNIIAFSQLIIGVDSGNIHLAAALGVQAFAIHGKYELSKYLPYDVEIISEKYPMPICISDKEDYSCQACLQKPDIIKRKNYECYYECTSNNGCMKCLASITVDSLMKYISFYMDKK